MMRAISRIFVLAVLLFTTSLAVAQGEAPTKEDKAQAQALFDEAYKLYQVGELEESAQTLEKAYEYDPNPVLAYNIGKAYDDAADLIKAEKWYRTALEAENLAEDERRKATKAVERIEKVRAQLSESESGKEQAEADRAKAEAEREAAEADRLRVEEEKAQVEKELAEATAGDETHDGFFVRVLLGPEFGSVSTAFVPARGDETEVRISGAGVSPSLSVGWAFWENLVLHVGFFNTTLNKPTINIGGADTDTKGTLNINSGFALGASYFWMPLNLYVSTSLTLGSTLAVSKEVKEKKDVLGKTSAGFGLEAVVGKEWWLSENWGLGAAVVLHMTKVEAPKDLPGDISGEFAKGLSSFTFGVMLSTTYN